MLHLIFINTQKKSRGVGARALLGGVGARALLGGVGRMPPSPPAPLICSHDVFVCVWCICVWYESMSDVLVCVVVCVVC